MSPELRGSLCAVVALLPFTDATSAEEKEPVAVVELGGASAWNIPGRAAFGPSAAVEFEPIKNYLVMEAGMTPYFDNGGHAVWDFDLFFRHSFALSKKAEFEPGIGPSFSTSGRVGAAASFEFMIWPWQERKFGWFVDPTYGVSFAPGHQQSFGLTVGILVGILP
jgi:hypothetical protein